MLQQFSKLMGCVCLCALFAFAAKAEEQTRYDQFLQSTGPAATVRTMGLFILASAHEPENVQTQIARFWWSNNPELELSEAQRDLASAAFRKQFETVKRVVQEAGFSSLSFAGFTQFGTINSVEIYYAADSATGPVVFRVSITFRDDAGPLLHDISIFRGFEQAREAIGEIQFVAGKNIASVSYDPKPDGQREGGNDAN